MASIVVLTLGASPALAGATDWQQIAPGVTARLIASDRVVDGHTLAGIEIQLPAGTNTYWRIPGETGIPTEIDASASTGLGGVEVLWPYPTPDRSEGYRNFVYQGTVVLPIRFAVEGTGPAIADAAVSLGVCSDICVPASAHFTLPLDLGKPDTGQGIRLDQALADVPIGWDQPGQPFGDVSIAADGTLRIAAPDPAVDPASLIVDTGDPSVLFDTPQKSPDGSILTTKPLGGAVVSGLEGQPIQLTFMTDAGPYAVTRTVSAAP